MSRTYSGPSLDALARRALASPPEHPQARALPRAVYAGTALVAPFVTGMRPGGQRAALYVARDPRAQGFTDQEKRLLASFAAHLGAALGRGILPALGSLQWLDPTRAAGATPTDVLLQQRPPSAENAPEPSREATAPAVLPARRRAHAVSAKPERPSEDAPKAVRSTRPRSRPPAALSLVPSAAPEAPEAAPAEAPAPTPPQPPAAPASRRSRTKTPLLAA